MGLSLGTMNQVSNGAIAQAVGSLLGDSTRRRQMRAAGLMTIDGLGASRIAADLASELAAAGVPAIYLGISDDHAQSASAFEQAGMGQSLGTMNRASNAEIAQAVWSLLGDSTRRRQMRAAGLMTIDGSGASRIAADLASELAARRAEPKSVTKTEAL